jgi:hypothetical protein
MITGNKTMWTESKDILEKIRETIIDNDNKDMAIAEGEIFYHYTNSTGLLGIFESNNLWATHFRFLNDSSEFEYGMEIIFDILNEYLESKSIVEEDKKRIIEVFKLQESLFNDNTAYITCFCTDGDLLSQWRGYAGGSGYAIGFDSKFLNNKGFLDALKDKTNIRWDFGRVRYGDDAKQFVKKLIPNCVDIVNSYLVDFPEGLSRTRNGKYVTEYIHSLQSLRWLFYNVAFFSKHDGFREEMEWRLVGIPTGIPLTKYRTTGTGIIPYVEFNFSDELFTIQPAKYFPDEYLDENNMPKKRRETPFSKDEYREMYNNLWKMGPEQGKVNYIKKIIIGPSSNFEQQKYAVNDLIKQLTHRSIYKYMLSRRIDYSINNVTDDLSEMPDGLNFGDLTPEHLNSIRVEENYTYFCMSERYIDLPDICQSIIP